MEELEVVSTKVTVVEKGVDLTVVGFGVGEPINGQEDEIKVEKPRCTVVPASLAAQGVPDGLLLDNPSVCSAATW